jgi:hypothetical protein
MFLSFKWKYFSKGPAISLMYMRRLMQIPSGQLTIIVDHTNTKSTLKWIPKLEQAYVSMSVSVMNPSRICFSKIQNCRGKLLTKVFNCIASLN